MISAKRNNSIDIFRLICAILVVVIHTNPFKGIIGLEFITYEILPRIAVPFFFVVAGFFYFQTLQVKKKIFSKYLFKTIITYTCWSIFYFLIVFIQQISEGKFEIVSFVKSCVLRFVLTGSYYHFWFFPALIFSVLIVSVVYKLRGLKILYVIGFGLYLIGCLGCAYYDVALNIPLLSMLVQNNWFETIRRILLMGLPFFLLGVALCEFKNKLVKVSVKTQLITLFCLILMFLAEFIVVKIIETYNNFTLTVFLYPLVGWIMIILYNNPAKKLTKLGTISRFVAEFIYYIHPAVSVFVSWVMSPFFNLEGCAGLRFVIVTIVSFGLGITWMRLNIKERTNKILNKKKANKSIQA